MQNLKKLALGIAFTIVIGLSASAGEAQAPSCAPPAPGEMQSPPCAIAQSIPDDSAVPGEINAPPASSATEYAVTEAAIDLLQSVLSLF